MWNPWSVDRFSTLDGSRCMLMTGILLNGRPPMHLSPSVSQHPDYIATVLRNSVDGSCESTLCEVRSSHVHEFTVRIIMRGKKFDISQWSLLSSECASLRDATAIRARTAESDASRPGGGHMLKLDADDQFRSFGYPRWVTPPRTARSAAHSDGDDRLRATLGAALRNVGAAPCAILEHCSAQYGQQCYTPGSGGNGTERRCFRLLDVALQDALGQVLDIPDGVVFVLLPAVPSKEVPDAMLWAPPQLRTRSLGVFIEVIFSHEDGVAGPGTAPLLQLFQLVDHGRCAQRVLVYSSDTRRVCRALQPSVEVRDAPWVDGSEWAGGDALGVTTTLNRLARSVDSSKLLDRSLTELGDGAGPMATLGGPDSELGEPVFTACGILLASAPPRPSSSGGAGGSGVTADTARPSLLIQRDVTLPGGGVVRETFVPGRIVSQLLPTALSATRIFWARAAGRQVPGAGNAAAEIVGYPRMAAEATSAADALERHQRNSEGVWESDLLRVRINAAGAATISLGAATSEPTAEVEKIDAAARLLGARSVNHSQRFLLAACNAPAPSALGRLHNILTRVEAASHILVWGRQCEPHGHVIVSSVELPRLGLSFVVKFGRCDERTRIPKDVSLSSVEYSGYRLLNSRSRLSGSSSRLDRLAMGIPFALLLESEVDPGRLMFLVPTYPVRRPAIGRTPFSHALRPVRRAGWLQAMPVTRVYALPVHPSLEALVYNGAREPALLHVSLLLWLRQPQQAARLLHTATLDSDPTPEQTWLLHNAFCTGDDDDPDAIAVRLRLQVCACAFWAIPGFMAQLFVFHIRTLLRAVARSFGMRVFGSRWHAGRGRTASGNTYCSVAVCAARHREWGSVGSCMGEVLGRHRSVHAGTRTIWNTPESHLPSPVVPEVCVAFGTRHAGLPAHRGRRARHTGCVCYTHCSAHGGTNEQHRSGCW